MRLRTASLALLALAGCVSDSSTGTTTPVTSSNPVNMQVVGRGNFSPARRTGEVFVRGNTAYTTTWGTGTLGGVIYIWDVVGAPILLDSIKVSSAPTLGDIAVSDDGQLLIVATEQGTGSIVIYSLADPRKPVQISRYSTNNTVIGVHTAEIGRVNGKLFGFLSIDPGIVPAKLVIVDLSDPVNPKEVFQQSLGAPYMHDALIRDGFLFLGLWNDGVAIWDVGGGALGGTPSAPKEIGRLKTINGEVHNVSWLKDPVTGSAKYAFIGEEGPSSIGNFAVGDVHVVDISNMAAPKEVAFYTVTSAGAHNFSIDETNGILYAAFYNGGVRALDVRGDLGTCTAEQKSSPANSTVQLCDLRKMGRELGIGLLDQGNSVYVWGVQYVNGAVYASDMLNGIWKLKALSRP